MSDGEMATTRAEGTFGLIPAPGPGRMRVWPEESVGESDSSTLRCRRTMGD